MQKIIAPSAQISIHALVKRATYGADKVSVGLGDFNPRPREEGDDGEFTECVEIVFQSTPS